MISRPPLTIAIGAALGLLGALAVQALWIATGSGAVWIPMGLLVILGVAFTMTGRFLWILSLDAVCWIAVLILATTPVVRTLTVAWVRSDELPSTPIEAAVVLSSGVNRDSTLSPPGVDRLLEGIALWNEGKVIRLVTTREERRVGGHLVSSDRAQQQILTPSGATAAWTTVAGATTTRQEAEQAARVLFPQGIRTVAVVTSPLHTRRACATFEKAGFRVYCVAAPGHEVATWYPENAGDRLRAWRTYIYERLGMIKYGANGWV